MNFRSTRASLGFLYAAIFLLATFGSEVRADSPPIKRTDSFYDEWSGKAKEGKKGRFAGTHYYWDEGFHIVSRRENFRLKIGGKFILDGGYIEADKELEGAFPDLEGYGGDFRFLSVDFTGTIRPLSALRERSYAPYDALAFKLEIDFANVREVKDIWLRFPGIPLLGYFTFGHMKEPFSLEMSTSITSITFMERALPNEAFAAIRNIGIRFDKPILNERVTLAAGGFWNTGSFSDTGQAKDRITEANGYNLTVRVTGLPWYADEGERLLHLGFSYSYQVRNDADVDDRTRFVTRPESRLTHERLVNATLFTEGVDLINPELAIVLGPFSVQGEYFHAFTDADRRGDPAFWGFYVQGSYFLTGEHRNYKKPEGVFSRVRPKHNFRPLKGGWGALELAARFSYIDLNDKDIRGGRERNFTAGLNWYLTRNYRFMFNYIRATVKDRAVPQIDNGRANIFQARFQVAY
jgi:phosphate-selective porin OprO/OprP